MSNVHYLANANVKRAQPAGIPSDRYELLEGEATLIHNVVNKLKSDKCARHILWHIALVISVRHGCKVLEQELEHVLALARAMEIKE